MLGKMMGDLIEEKAYPNQRKRILVFSITGMAATIVGGCLVAASQLDWISMDLLILRVIFVPLMILPFAAAFFLYGRWRYSLWRSKRRDCADRAKK